MNCPACGDAMRPTDMACPRCHGKGFGQSAAPGRQPGDRPSFLVALIGFCLPVVGLILFLAGRGKKPRQARSAVRGAALGTLLGLMMVPVALWITSTTTRKPIYSDLADMISNLMTDDGSSACRDNLQHLSQAVSSYAKAHNGKLPDLSSSAAMRKALDPYVTDQRIYKCASSGEIYLINRELSGKLPAQIPHAATVRLFFEDAKANRHRDGSNVVYADGNVQFVAYR